MILDPLLAPAVPQLSNAQNLDAWLLLAIVPITSFLTLLVQTFVSRRKVRTDVEVAKTGARVSEMDVAFDGLTSNLNSMQDQLKELRGELRDTKADARRTQDDLNTTRSDLRRLETVVSDLRVERLHFLAHITLLESLVPVPPGPPARPIFMSEDRTQSH